MSSQITTAFVQQYSNNVQMLSQQKGSLLRNAVDAETIVGKNAFFEQVGQGCCIGLFWFNRLGARGLGASPCIFTS